MANYYTPLNQTDHSTCSNEIYNYDFDGYTSMKSMAEKIISDWKFDEECRKNIKNKQKGNTNDKNRI